MNKELLDQLSADERQVAEKLSSAAETMKLSQSFQWNLETKLMDAYPSQNEKGNSIMKFLKPAGWAFAAVVAVLLVSWIFRTSIPGIQPGTMPTETQEVSFEENVRQGNICAAPLAVAHNFGVYLTSPDKTQFAVVDAGNSIGEIRSFTWSADGKELLLLGNSPSGGNIYHADPVSDEIQQMLPPGELGYMMNAAWSRDEKKVVLWSAQNNKTLYMVNADGTGLEERNLGNTQIIGAPQFWPDGSSIVFFGATPTSFGLFELMLNDSEPALINTFVESETSYAFSPDGSHLAYMEYDHEFGEARLISQDLTSYEPVILGTFPIPKGSGSSVPITANMIWSADGRSIIFDVGRGANDRVIYLAHIEGTELIKVVDAGYAPAISEDGRCLAYMEGKKLILLDLSSLSSTGSTTTVELANLPAGKGGPNYQLDKLQWRP
jgi:hypothetical protein